MPWIEREFGWSRQTADNFTHVFERVKLPKVSNLQIDVSALYLIAAPKTPEPVRKEIIARAQAGEPMTHAKAVEVLESYKAKAEVPTGVAMRKIKPIALGSLLLLVGGGSMTQPPVDMAGSWQFAGHSTRFSLNVTGTGALLFGFLGFGHTLGQVALLVAEHGGLADSEALRYASIRCAVY